MVKDVLQQIGGLGIYAITSLLLFFTVFNSALIWALLQSPSLCAKMESIPLEDETKPAKAESI